MPLWGAGHKFGESGLKFGSAFSQFLAGQPGALTAPQAATWQTYAGASPAFPTIHPAARFLCADLHTFDTGSWTPGAVLPGIAPGAVRTASLGGVSWEQQSLSFTVADLPYYQSGAGAGLLVPDAYVCVVWTVQVPGIAAQTYQSPPFRLVTGPQPVWDASSGTWQGKVSAVDFAQPVCAAKNLEINSRWLYADSQHVGSFEDMVTAYVAAGGVRPVADLQAMFVAAVWQLLTTVSGVNFHAFAAEPWDVVVTPDAAGSTFVFGPGGGFFLSWGSAGTMTAPYDQFNTFYPLLGGFRQTFDAAGRLLLRGWTPRDSGWFISCNAAAPGAQPLPWVLPLTRSTKAPAYSAVRYHRVNSPSPAGTVGGSEIDTIALSAEVRAWALANPYRNEIASVEQLVDRDTSQSWAGYASPTQMCHERLRGYLGAADTLSIAVDASVPPPQLGTVLRVQLPPEVDGQYIVTGWSQPLSGGMGSLQTQWYADS